MSESEKKIIYWNGGNSIIKHWGISKKDAAKIWRHCYLKAVFRWQFELIVIIALIPPIIFGLYFGESLIYYTVSLISVWSLILIPSIIASPNITKEVELLKTNQE